MEIVKVFHVEGYQIINGNIKVSLEVDVVRDRISIKSKMPDGKFLFEKSDPTLAEQVGETIMRAANKGRRILTVRRGQDHFGEGLE